MRARQAAEAPAEGQGAAVRRAVDEDGAAEGPGAAALFDQLNQG